MSHISLEEQLQTAIKIAHSLYARGKVSGSTANISFRIADIIYISGSGTSFETLTPEQFAAVTIDGLKKTEQKPSKELPLHAILYQKRPDIHAVLHTHSFHATLWSCLSHEKEEDVIPNYTPYLKMKVGTVGMIPYAPPGSKALFEHLEKRVFCSDAYLLKQHGPVVPGATLLDAYYGLEELEESARLAWYLRQEKCNIC